MPLQRIRHSRETCEIPEDFSQRLNRFQKVSGLSWSEIARRIETYRHTVWRWAEGRTRPSYQHRRALYELAASMGLGHLLGRDTALLVGHRDRHVNALPNRAHPDSRRLRGVPGRIAP